MQTTIKSEMDFHYQCSCDSSDDAAFKLSDDAINGSGVAGVPVRELWVNEGPHTEVDLQQESLIKVICFLSLRSRHLLYSSLFIYNATNSMLWYFSIQYYSLLRIELN